MIEQVEYAPMTPVQGRTQIPEESEDREVELTNDGEYEYFDTGNVDRQEKWDIMQNKFNSEGDTESIGLSEA